jgi:phosphate transport system substrate-binding protein
MSLSREIKVSVVFSLMLSPLVMQAWSIAGHELFKTPASWAAEGVLPVNKTRPFKYETKGFAEQAKLAAANSVDFLITDKPPQGAKSSDVFPIALNAIVIALRIDGFNNAVKLKWPTVKAILEGKVQSWGDPLIVADVPELKGNATPLVFVYSKENFGLQQIFGAFMKRQKLKLTRPNHGVRVSSPKLVGATIKNTNGAIGLIDFAWMQEYNLKAAHLQNKAGQFVAPTSLNVRASAEATFKRLRGRYASVLLNPDGASSYPVFGFIYLVVVNKETLEKDKTKIKNFIDKTFDQNGSQMVARVGFEPMPEQFKKEITKSLK